MKSFEGKLLIFAAPSGAGKTTIVKHLLKTFDQLAFSVSATSRQRRPHEVDGRDYYFLSPEEFKQHIQAGDFLEWEEVYEDQFYGTLKSEINRLWAAGKHIIFDIDVVGALNIKEQFPHQATTVFVMPPAVDVLVRRLKGRQTENEESLRKRIRKVEEELGYRNKFDLVLVNDVLEDALKQAEKIVEQIIL